MEKEHKNDLSNEELCILAQGGDDEAVVLCFKIAAAISVA